MIKAGCSTSIFKKMLFLVMVMNRFNYYKLNYFYKLLNCFHYFSDWGSDNVVSSRTLMVNSVVISASFFSPNCTLNTTGFTTNVTITFFHVNNSLNDPSCSFLDSSDNRYINCLSNIIEPY